MDDGFDYVAFALRVLGKKFGTEFRVVAIDAFATATLVMHGDTYRISLEELRTIVERGLVTEMPERER